MPVMQTKKQKQTKKQRRSLKMNFMDLFSPQRSSLLHGQFTIIEKYSRQLFLKPILAETTIYAEAAHMSFR